MSRCNLHANVCNLQMILCYDMTDSWERGRFMSLRVSFLASSSQNRTTWVREKREWYLICTNFHVFSDKAANFMRCNRSYFMLHVYRAYGRPKIYTRLSSAPVNSPFDAVLFLVLRREFSSSQHSRYTDALS